MKLEQEIIDKLVATRKWSPAAVRLGIRANFKCEYCGKDLLASVENYKEWNFDHIIPKKHGGTDDDENIAVACRTCNVSVKSRWNPAEHITGKPTRAKLISETREYIKLKRVELQKEITYFNSVVNNMDN